MPSTNIISTPVKGMQTDLHRIQLDEQSYTFALNAITSDFYQGNEPLIGNEPSTLCSVAFPPFYQVIGFKEITEQKRTIYFLFNPITGKSQIGEVRSCIYSLPTDKIEKVFCANCPEYSGTEANGIETKIEKCHCEYKLIIETDCLNLNVNYPVDIEYKLTSCGINIYFTDNFNERRFLYFTYSNDDINGDLLIDNRFKVIDPASVPCQTPIYLDELDCEKIKLHPTYAKPCVKFIEFVNGGNLKEGSYQILIAYADIYGNPTTTYTPASPVAPLFGSKIKFETNNETFKALSFKIDNLKIDSIFQYYNIVIVQTIDQFTEFILAGTFPVTQHNYVFTGFEKSVKRLDATEVLFRRPFYKTAKGVTKANDFLFFTGVTEYPLLNLQKAVNNIEVFWQTSAVKEGAYAKAETTFNLRGYMRDEVYPIGIVFEMTNARETCAFHIPGRATQAGDTDVISNNDVIPVADCNNTTLNKRWQLYNTATIIGTDHQYSESCEDPKCWEYGKLAYWESTETYPDVPEIWGSLCGQKIRHHKMPDSSVTHIHDSFNGTKGFNDQNYIFPLGIRINHQSVVNALNQAVTNGTITAQDRADIIGYRIVRGNRVGHKSIDAKGLLFNMFGYNRFGKDYLFPNYAYNDVSADPFLNGVGVTPQRYTFHSPDVHFVNTSLGDIVKLETEEYGKTEGYFTYSDCQSKHKFLSSFAHILAFGLGIAAAISATGEKQCKVITYEAADTVTGKGEQYWSNVSGTLANGTGTISTIGKKDDVKGEATVKHDGLGGIQAQNPVTGINENPTNGSGVTTIGNFSDKLTGIDVNGKTYDIKTPKRVEYTTCKGAAYQIFNSDTYIGTLFTGINKVIQRTFLGIIEMEKVLDTIRALIPYRNYSIQYNSIGNYNNWTTVPEGNKVRKLDKTAYLNPQLQNVDEPSANPSAAFTSVAINNWDRESSVYLKTNLTVNNTTHVDNSKVSMRELGFDVDDLNKRFNRDIASYYGSIKRYVPNQYGQICNINYLETNSCTFNLNTTYPACDVKVFGGDIFINRFALKRKMPFFTHTMCKLPNGSDVEYTELANVGVGNSGSNNLDLKFPTKYFFDVPTPLGERITDLGFFPGIFSAITKDNVHNYDVKKNQLFNQNGYIHLYNYGIPNFFVESDINVDLRHGQDNRDKDFYPHNRDLKSWLEEENVPIKTDNNYFYNRTYSKQNNENIICTSCVLNLNDLKCQSTNYNRIVYSDTTDTENKNDNWLIFKANNYYDFPLALGKLVTADGIENDKVLVRLEKGTQIFNAYNTIQATGANIQVGTGGIFKTRPQDVAITDLGYAGTQHKDILHTEFGHIWADAERGQIFNLPTGGNGMDELGMQGMKNWFKSNLPFQILKDFPNLPIEAIDNNLNGIGLHYCFDKRFNRFLMTKLDYKRLNPHITYNATTKKFMLGGGDGDPIEVKLNNPKYFCNKGWTISYDFFKKSWVSFHSYIPNFYVEHIEGFESGYKDYTGHQKLYAHNMTNKSYQVVYGKLQPFIVEFSSKFGVQNSFINSVEYFVDVLRYHNDFDVFYNRQKTFNKVILYNDHQTSGLLRFKVRDPENLSQSIEYPKRVQDGYEVLTTNSENAWRFNDFFDVSKNQLNNIPLFNYDCNNANKQLNLQALNYDKPDFERQGIRDRAVKVRLINDAESRYKFIFNYGQINQHQSIR